MSSSERRDSFAGIGRGSEGGIGADWRKPLYAHGVYGSAQRNDAVKDGPCGRSIEHIVQRWSRQRWRSTVFEGCNFCLARRQDCVRRATPGAISSRQERISQQALILAPATRTSQLDELLSRPR